MLPPRARGFTTTPEPKTIGSEAQGRQLLAGNLLFAGVLIEAEGTSPWAITAPSEAFLDELHGFGWLDHLAAVTDRSGRGLAQDWVTDWLARYGGGRGPGWTPDLTGRRQIRWINHAIFLMNGWDLAAQTEFFDALGRQTRILHKRWKSTSHGLPRFEALAGLIYSACALTGMGGYLPAALKAMGAECEASIDAEGGIASRNPEELLEIFTLLSWCDEILTETKRAFDPAIKRAIARIAPTLRMLRHADGGLARFHGGGRGVAGRLDHALANSGTRPGAPSGLAMGYGRLTENRVTLIVDAAPPRTGPEAKNAHASTLAFEMTSNRRPVIVSCGSGAGFGPDWRRAGRATASHSTLVLDGHNSALLGPPEPERGVMCQPLLSGPREVELSRAEAQGAQAIALSHDGWRESHGLVHMRSLSLERGGRLILGEDGIAALEEEDRDRLDRLLARLPGHALPFSVRFHLHPDVEARVDMGGQAVSLSLKGGETWVFRHSGAAQLRLANSVYLEKGRLKPRSTKQIVLYKSLETTGTALSWSLSKPADCTQGHRDYTRGDAFRM